MMRSDNDNGGRWRASVFYRSDATGYAVVERDIEELDEIAEIVESGPDWNSIEKIEIVLLRRSYGEIISIEKAQRL